MRTPTRIQIVETAIADASGLSIEEIRGRGRSQPVADARHAVWFIAYTELGYSSTYLGQLYERDHTTILNGIKRIERSPENAKIVDGIRKTYPGAVKKITGPSSARSLEAWQFEGVD